MTAGPVDESRRPDRPPISLREQLLHVLALSGFAFAQPLYDLLGRNPTFFVYRRSQPLDFLFLVLVVSVLVPFALAAVGELLGWPGQRIRRWSRAGLIATLVALIPLPLAVRFESAPPWLIVAAVALIGVAAALARERFSLCRQFFSILALSIPLFPGLFLFRDGVREQWLGTRAQWEVGGAGSGAPVVFLVLDALPTASLMDDRYEVDPIRYPNFARLARSGSWFRRATTVDAYTNRSVPAILSGVCPSESKAPILQEYPRNVFTHAASAYRLEVHETVTRLCPRELCEEQVEAFGERLAPLLVDASIAFAHATFPIAWRTRLPAIDSAWGDFAREDGSTTQADRGRRADEVTRFEGSLTQIRRSSPPVFFFAHLVLPHRPFVYLPSGRNYRPEDSGRALAEPWGLRHNYQRHLLQLAFVDTLLGRVFDRLDAEGLFDESLVVVTADHGVSFREGQPPRSLGEANAVDILAVPLFIKRPGQRVSEVRDDPVQTVDILPSLAEAIGLATPAWADGRSLPRGTEAVRTTRSCPQIRRQEAPRTPLSELFAAAETKTALFGTGATAGRFPATGPHREVVQTSVSESACRNGQENLSYSVQNRELLELVDTTSGFIPAEVAGFIKGPDAHRGVNLAVAINGTVVATTRSYRSGVRDVFPWKAIVPERSFRDGGNSLALFGIRTEEGDCRLEPLRPLDGGWEPSLLDVRLGAWPVPRVEEKGFGRSAIVDGTTLRKLRRRAQMRIPLSHAEGEPLAGLRLELEVLDEAGAVLTVRVDGERRFRQEVGAGPWVGTLDLKRQSRPEPLVLTIRSVGLGPQRKRKSVVAVRGIWLLSEDS